MGPKKVPGDLSADPEALSSPRGLLQPPASKDAEQEAGHGPRAPSPKPLLSAPMRNGESPGQEGLANLVLDARCPLGELDRDILRRSRLKKAQTFPRLLQESTEASTLCLSLTSSRNQLTISEFFPPDPRKLFLEGKNGLSGFKAQSKSRLWPEQEPGVQLGKAPGAGRNPHRSPGASGPWEASSPSQGPVEYTPLPCPVDPGDSDHEGQISRSEEGIPGGSGQLESAAKAQVCEGGGGQRLLLLSLNVQLTQDLPHPALPSLLATVSLGLHIFEGNFKCKLGEGLDVTPRTWVPRSEPSLWPF